MGLNGIIMGFKVTVGNNRNKEILEGINIHTHCFSDHVFEICNGLVISISYINHAIITGLTELERS